MATSKTDKPLYPPKQRREEVDPHTPVVIERREVISEIYPGGPDDPPMLRVALAETANYMLENPGSCRIEFVYAHERYTIEREQGPS